MREFAHTKSLSEREPASGTGLLRIARQENGSAPGAGTHDFARLRVFPDRGDSSPVNLGQPLEPGATEAEPQGGGTDRKQLFCYQCPQKANPKVAVYSQWSSDFRNDNITFARIFLLNHNIDLDVNHAGVIPPFYDEKKKKFAKVDSVASLCDILKGLQDQGVFPPKAGTLPVLFIPFGKQLQGQSGEALGWFIADIKSKCQDFAQINASKVALIDSDPDTVCNKAMLHEVSHAVGNVDVPDAPAIMGPCDPKMAKNPAIPCDPDAKEHTMTATEVKKFCAGTF